MEIRVTVEPAAEAISAAQVKAHLRVFGTDEDALIDAWITAARQRCEGELLRPLLPQTRVALMDTFPCFIPLGPNVTTVASVTYRDTEGQAQTLPPEAYRLVDDERLVPTGSWPAGDTVRVTFQCGAFTAATVPQALRAWMLLQIGAMHEQREAVSNGQTFEPPGRFVDGLLDPWRYPVV